MSRYSLPSAKPNLVLGLADCNSTTPEDVSASGHLALDSVRKQLILTDLTDAFQKLWPRLVLVLPGVKGT